MSEVGEQTVHLAFKGAEMSVEVLYKLFRALLENLKASKTQEQTQSKEKTGKQSLKSLSKQNNELVPVDIDNQNIKEIQRELKKDGVDFSIRKNKNTNDKTLFFKAKDSNIIEYAIERQLANTERNRELEKGKTPADKNDEVPTKEQGFHEYELAAQARERENSIDRQTPKQNLTKAQQANLGAKKLQQNMQTLQEQVNKKNEISRAKAPQHTRNRGKTRG